MSVLGIIGGIAAGATALNGLYKQYKESKQKEQSIIDRTEENLSNGINGIDYNQLLQQANQNQKEMWAREDEIRKETQEREDTAWQRAVEDMRKAGVNPNLVNANPAASGGGVTQPNEKDTSAAKEYIQNALDAAMKQAELDKENKDIGTDEFKNIANGLASLAMVWKIMGGGK